MSAGIAWALLLAAGAFEIVWLICMRFSDGFTRWWPSIGVLASGGLSLMLVFGESRDLDRIASLMMVIIGLIGLKLGGSHA